MVLWYSALLWVCCVVSGGRVLCLSACVLCGFVLCLSACVLRLPCVVCLCVRRASLVLSLWLSGARPVVCCHVLRCVRSPWLYTAVCEYPVMLCAACCGVCALWCSASLSGTICGSLCCWWSMARYTAYTALLVALCVPCMRLLWLYACICAPALLILRYRAIIGRCSSCLAMICTRPMLVWFGCLVGSSAAWSLALPGSTRQYGRGCAWSVYPAAWPCLAVW